MKQKGEHPPIFFGSGETETVDYDNESPRRVACVNKSLEKKPMIKTEKLKTEIKTQRN